ncbi:putative hydrogenase nickel incorporation protein HypA [Desulfuromonas versatilis]|uniref:Hydrogenase maturation factor HypA n=1 Tax=Desulfuromonas versatilis TaxID=2802975 RepID=A0ABN6E2Z7_9BACT|nr:hydrogenase maturation nickel metallochaperone HypA [Desulfuromonas versatilis]BCR06577.1 putative hydrogenase nickel incorporation protein HypA [Desulfuromonas versatilis]
MHEVGITQSIVEIAERTARSGGAKRVLSVTVEIGALSGVIPEAVEFCFEACSKGTFLENARLIIERVPGMGRCPNCAGETEIDAYSCECPACGAFGLETLQGKELRVKEMEID